MLPGEYELNTVHKEVMDIQRGTLEVYYQLKIGLKLKVLHLLKFQQFKI